MSKKPGGVAVATSRTFCEIRRRRSRKGKIAAGTICEIDSTHIPMTDFTLWALAGLILIIFVLPLASHKIEKNLELFLLLCGAIAVSISQVWSKDLIWAAAHEAIPITTAVFFAGALFRLIQKRLRKSIWAIEERLGYPLFAFLLVVLLGLLSSAITAIIAALVLAEIISGLNLNRRSEVILVVLACFSIGLGASLTPIGEPLATIAIAKLKGEPYRADFWFLMRLLVPYIVPAILLLGTAAAFVHAKADRMGKGLVEDKPEEFVGIVWRAGKVYLFIIALIFLGAGYLPLIDTYVVKLPWQALYWINIISAALDNATLTAAEISPALSLVQIRAILIGLLISGVILVPGNIPNIIAASKLKIRAREWAKWGLPSGLILLVAYFIILQILTKTGA